MQMYLARTLRRTDKNNAHLTYLYNKQDLTLRTVQKKFN